MAAKKQAAKTSSKTTGGANRATSKTGSKSKASTATRSRPKKPDNATRFTENHRVIRKWAEERGGTPATVKGTRRRNDPAGVLRIDFPGYSGEGTLVPIPWEDFFAKFDNADLAFLYQKQTADGSPSRFCKFISMEDAESSGAREVTGGADTPDGSDPGRSHRAGPRGGRKARTTTSHRIIRRWAEQRGGAPATVKGTRRRNDPAGVLRIDFPGYSGEGTLKPISWDDFFAKFDESRLLFLYQDQAADGNESRFCKFIHMDEGRDEG